jgi:hypothetical protein
MGAPLPRKKRDIDDDSVVSDLEKDEEDDAKEQPQFRYSTADMTTDSKRNTTCCLVAMCVICVAVAIVVSIVLAGADKNSDDNDSESVPTMAPVVGQPVQQQQQLGSQFVSTREFVENRCSSEKIVTDRLTCEGICTGFDCCDPFLPQNVSCFVGNQLGCLNYARCHALDRVFDAPPDNLRDICSPERIATNPTECEQQCISVDCCWSEEDSCIAENFYTCVDYAPCQYLRGVDKVRVPLPTPNVLEQLCDVQVTNSVTQSGECEEQCAPAECCGPDAADSCLQSDFIFCLFYGPCGLPELAPAHVAIVAPQEPIGDVCSTSNIAEQGPGACQTACAFVECCTEDGLTNCFNDDPLGCLAYDACKLVR